MGAFEREPLITGARWSRSSGKKRGLKSSAEMPPPYTPTVAAASSERQIVLSDKVLGLAS